LLKGQERREGLEYPDRELRYFMLAERFGWPPTVVDEQPVVLLDWLLAIGEVVDEVKSDGGH
jgi:hypothetical protein